MAGEHAVRLHLRPERKDVLVHIRVVVRCVDERLCGEAAGEAGQPDVRATWPRLAEAGRG